jgi:choline-sulfatase
MFNLTAIPHEFVLEHNDEYTLETSLATDSQYAAKRKDLERLMFGAIKRRDDPHSFWKQPK